MVTVAEPVRPPALSPFEMARWIWRQLTSMRTALFLLFLLALAAIPGSLFPQRGVNPVEVSAYRAAHPGISPWLDRVGAFDVYATPWFAATYLLLFVSLVGCVLPRSLQHFRAMRGAPPRAPRNLMRLPVSRYFDSSEPPAAILARASGSLRGSRFRVVDGDGWVAGEKGYLRETGNLIFHLSLVVLLVGVAIGSLGGVKGIALVVEGDGFANTVTQYDQITPGRAYDLADLPPFSFTLDDFRATYEAGPVQTGAARTFEAQLSVVDRPGATPRIDTVQVNAPLNVDGFKVFLVGHGYAPVFTVRDGRGRVVLDQPVPCIPQDGNFSSQCVVKVPDARPEQLAFTGFFFPTVVPGGGPASYFPGAENPEAYLNAWTGDLHLDDGVARSVYSLDTDGLTAVKSKPTDGIPLVMPLKVGDTYTLPDGLGTVTFTGLQEWATFEVAHDPGKGLALAGAVGAIGGLLLSLFVRRRRVWVRAKAGPSGATVVEVAGLSKTEGGRVEDDVDALSTVLLDRPGSVRPPESVAVPGLAPPGPGDVNDANDEHDEHDEHSQPTGRRGED